MDKYTIDESQYLNGYAKGYADGKKDAVEVVRCKDCKYWEKGKDYEPYCNNWANMMTDTQAEDFCSYGERKNEQS